MSGWPLVKLSEVCDKPQYGAIARGTKSGEGPLFVRQTDISRGRINWTSVPFCDLEASEFEKYRLHKGDILVSRLGAGVGNSATVDQTRDAVFAGYLVRFQPKRDICIPEFVGYQLQSHRWRQHVGGIRSGAAQPTLNAQQMGDFSFQLPPLKTQESIVGLLGKFDEMFETGRHLIQSLEELGSTVLADQLEEGVEYAPLGDCLLVIETGQRPVGGAIATGHVSLGAENIQSAGIAEHSAFKRVPEEFAQSLKRGRLKDLDVLMYKDGAGLRSSSSIVSAFGYGFPTRAAVINEHVFRLRARPQISQALLYWILRSTHVDGEIRRRVTGAAQPGLNVSNLKEVPIPEFHPTVLERLNTLLAPMLELMLRIGAENQMISDVRERLLPDLLSGEITVASEGGL